MKKIILTSLIGFSSLFISGCSFKIENTKIYNKINNKEGAVEQIINSKKVVVNKNLITFIQIPCNPNLIKDDNKNTNVNPNLKDDEVDAYEVVLNNKNKDKLYILNDIPLNTFIFFFKDN